MKRKCGKQSYRYYFGREKCKNCSKRKECVASAKSKILEIGIDHWGQVPMTTCEESGKTVHFWP